MDIILCKTPVGNFNKMFGSKWTKWTKLLENNFGLLLNFYHISYLINTNTANSV